MKHIHILKFLQKHSLPRMKWNNVMVSVYFDLQPHESVRLSHSCPVTSEAFSSCKHIPQESGIYTYKILEIFSFRSGPCPITAYYNDGLAVITL